MKRIELLKLLEDEVRTYRQNALESIERNLLSTSLSKKELTKLKKVVSVATTQKFIDAVLVCFINYVASGQCVDLGLKTSHISD